MLETRRREILSVVSHIVEEEILETGLIEKGVVINLDTGVEITLDMGLIEEGVHTSPII